MSSSRFPHGDSRYSRDRSPPSRFEQRRGSMQGPGRSDVRPDFSAPPRDAPRAPKADKDGLSRGGFGSRGRGTFQRGGDRDSYRRDWSSSADGNYRARSRSPPTRDYRDKEPMRGGPPSTGAASSDGGFAREGARSRGRDFDRSRGRGLMPEDRDYNARSRSRDRWREADTYRRDVPVRPESRNSGGSQTSPSTPLVSNVANPLGSDRFRDRTTPSGDGSRRPSFASSHDPRNDIRAALRPESQQSQSPTSPPTAPATFPPRQPSGPPEPRAGVPDPTLVAPKAPKAELQIPTGPRANALYAKRATPTAPGHRHDIHDVQSPSAPRYSGRPAGAVFSAPSQPRNFAPRTSPTFARPPSQDGSTDGSHAHKPIPTGPRAQQQPSIRNNMARPAEPAGMAMRRNTIPPKQPSIMKPMIPTKRDSGGDERPGHERRDSAGSGGEPRRASASILGNRDHGHVRRNSEKMDLDVAPADEEAESIGGPDESEEDNLDEEDFEEAEKVFNKDMENLKAKRPPSPGHHPELMILLEELNALEAAADDRKNGVAPPFPVVEEPTQMPLGLPSPSSEHVEAAKEDTAQLEQASVSEELPVDGLPFLASGPPTPVSQLSFRDDQTLDAPKLVLEALIREQQDEEEEWKTMRDFYRANYKPWRLMEETMDEHKRREENLKKAASPQPPLEDAAPPTTGRRRDRSQYSTQEQEQEAIEMSKETYEREKREREEREVMDTTPKEELPDYTREVVIPDMLRKSDQRADMFEDVNHLVQTKLVLQAFFFTPPVDDFTEEEQEKFIEAYIATPKKWGHIAGELEGRDYQDCIRHYYLTKKETQYKVIAERRRTKRGRGKRVAAGRPKANALLPDRADPPGPEELTDAGRPKRAAAPAFFGEPKRDLSEGGKTTPSRKTANASKGDGDGADKPSGRGARGGRGGGARKEGAGRGRAAKTAATPATTGDAAKAPALTATAPLLAPTPSPQKQGAEQRRSKSAERRNEEQRLEVAQSLATLQGVVPVPGPGPVPQNGLPAGHTETWRVDHPRPPVVPVPELRVGLPPIPPAQGMEPTIQTEKAPARSSAQGRGPGQVTSYCSLITKSHTMCKNHYQRQIQNGKEPAWEKIANDANERIRRDGPPGPPPITPVTTQRRRVDSAPQQPTAVSTAQRTLAPNAEPMDIDKEPPLPVATHPQASPPVYSANRANPVMLRQAGSPAQPTDLPYVPARPVQEQQSPARPAQPRVPSGGYGAPVHPHEAQETDHRPSQPLTNDRFTDLLAVQHAQKYDPQRQGPLAQREPIDHGPAMQFTASRQPVDQQQATQQQQQQQQPPTILQPTSVIQGRPTIAELERGVRGAQIQPKPEPGSTELRREPSFERYRQQAQPTPMGRSNTNNTPPRMDPVRPASVAQLIPPTSTPTPVESRPAEKKRSNIMMMLNDDPPEPSPPKRQMPSGVGHGSPSNSMPMYQQPPAQPVYSRRDPIIEPSSRHHEPPPPPSRHGYADAGYPASVAMQQQHQQPPSVPPPQPERREAPGWHGSVQRPYYEQPRSAYPPVPAPPATSPPAQHSYLPQSRPSLAQTQMESPPGHHSRGSSYTGAHPHAPQSQLAAHPYAHIAPPPSSSQAHGPLPPQASPAPQHMPQPAYQRPQPSHPPPSPYAPQQQQPPQSLQPLQPPQPRPSSTFGMQGMERPPLGSHQDMMRREEELRRYGSPTMRQPYGAYPPPQPPNPQDRRYDDRRYDDRR